MDNKKIGSLGVDYLSICFNNSELLYPEFEKDETHPLWDGNIIIYKSNIISNENCLGRVPVQIKTTTTKNISDITQKKSISRKELEIYFNDGGILYFFVCIDNSQYSIYYSSLTQIKINSYLNKNKQKKIPITFTLFPKDNVSLFTNIITEFYHERKFKANSKTYSLDDIKNIQQHGFDGLTTKVSTLGYKNPIDRLFDQPFYLHAINSTNNTETPIGEVLAKTAIKEYYNCEIKINSKLFYNNYKVINEKEKVIYCFGKSIQIIITKIDEDLFKYNVNFNLSGTLLERINDIDFFISLLKYEYFYIDSKIYNFHASEKEWDENNPLFSFEKLKLHLEYYINIKETFDILNIKKQIDFANFNKEDNNNLRHLIAGIKYNQKLILNNHDEKYVLNNLKIGNLIIKIIMIKQEDGKYLIENYFDINFICYCQSQNDKNNLVVVSPFILLEKDEFKKISNIDYEKIYNSFLKLPDKDELFKLTNDFILRMLSSYDDLNIKDDELLNCSLKLSDWLLTKDIKNKNIFILNKLQIIRRKRELSDDENSLLFEIIKTEDNNTILAGVYILLNNLLMFKKHYEKLSQSEKEEFDNFPINYILKQIEDK